MRAVDLTVVKADGAARAGRLRTARGEIETPAFMPVATLGTVKSLGPDVILALRTCVIFALVIANALLLTGGRPLAALRETAPRDLGLLALNFLVVFVQHVH